MQLLISFLLVVFLSSCDFMSTTNVDSEMLNLSGTGGTVVGDDGPVGPPLPPPPSLEEPVNNGNPNGDHGNVVDDEITAEGPESESSDEENIEDDRAKDPVVGEINFDSGWVALLQDAGSGFDCVVFGPNCSSKCSGKNVFPEDYVNQSDFHSFRACQPRPISLVNQGNPWFMLFQRGHNPAISNFTNNNGVAIMHLGNSISVDFELDDGASYYLSIDGAYSGASQRDEELEVSFNDGPPVIVADQDNEVRSNEVWKSCYVAAPFNLNQGSNSVKFKARGGSVHLDGYRISSQIPDGIVACN